MYIDDIPLFGHIAFGIIDRGTNVLQVRATTLCPYSCVYCSVDAGPRSRHRLSEFIVEKDWLLKWARLAVELKNGDVIEALLDGVGEPPTHPEITGIVSGLKKIVGRVAMESRGYTLTKDLVDRLWESGLDRIHVSIDTLREEKARFLTGTPWYRVDRVMEVVEYIVRETGIDVMLTPVWIPGVNDRDIEEVIEWGLRIGVGKRFPPFGIQKYEIHRYGRRVPGVREPSWREFYEFIERLEKRYGIVLDHRKVDMGIRRTKRIPIKYRVGDKIQVRIVSPGWLRREVLAVDREEDVVVSLVGIEWSDDLYNRVVRARVIESENGVYLAETTSL